MADKEFEIHYKTTSDVSGAQQTERAIDGVSDSTKETSAAADKMQREIEDASKAIDHLGASAKKTEQELDDIQPPTRSLRTMREEIVRLTNELDNAAIGSQDFAIAQQRLQAANQAFATAQQGVAKGTRNTGQAMLDLSRAFEDAQYGIGGVLNNLPGLITSLGGSAGLAGVVSVVAVGLFTLVKHLGIFGETSEQQKERLDALTANLTRLAEAMDQISDDRAAAAQKKMELGWEAVSKQIESSTTQLHNQTGVLEEQVSANKQLIGVINQRIQTENALRQLLDPSYNQSKAAAEALAQQQAELQQQRERAQAEAALHVQQIEIDRVRDEANYQAAQQRLEQVQSEIVRINNRRAELEKYMPRSPNLRRPEAQAELEKQIADIGIPIQGTDEPARAWQLQKQLAEITVMRNSYPAQQLEFQTISKQLDQLIETEKELISAQPSAFQDLINGLDAYQSKLNAARAQDAAQAAEFEQRAATINSAGIATGLKASAAALDTAVANLQTEVAAQVATGPAAAQKIAEQTQAVAAFLAAQKTATSDGVIKAEELADLQQKFSQLTNQLAGASADAYKYVSEISEIFRGNADLLKKGQAELLNAQRSSAAAQAQANAEMLQLFQSIERKTNEHREQIKALFDRQ